MSKTFQNLSKTSDDLFQNLPTFVPSLHKKRTHAAERQRQTAPAGDQTPLCLFPCSLSAIVSLVPVLSLSLSLPLSLFHPDLNFPSLAQSVSFSAFVTWMYMIVLRSSTLTVFSRYLTQMCSPVHAASTGRIQLPPVLSVRLLLLLPGFSLSGPLLAGLCPFSVRKKKR